MVHQACLIFDLCFADLLCSEIRKGSSIVTHKVAGQAKTKVTNKLTLYKTCKTNMQEAKRDSASSYVTVLHTSRRHRLPLRRIKALCVVI